MGICLKFFGFMSLFLFLSTGCGYRPAYQAPQAERFSVAAAPMKAPYFEALQAGLAGVRAGLSQAGSLEGGSSYPLVIVEILRVDELPTAIGASGDQPLARGSA